MASVVSAYLAMYGEEPLTQEEIVTLQTEKQPAPVEDELVTVSFSEVYLTGDMVVTVALAKAKEGANVVVMPGSASMGDPVAGGNGEQVTDDPRSFAQVAQEEGKRLIAVYAYPMEYEEIGTYGLDHLMQPDGVCALIGMAYFEEPVESFPFTWLVEVYEVDLTSEVKTLLASYTVAAVE